jgi:hypothetical protein
MSRGKQCMAKKGVCRDAGTGNHGRCMRLSTVL